MVVLSVLRAEYLPAILFASLAGAALGFLRYNFNPASIFLGDGGSYFLGYAVAGLAVMGSVKTEVGTAMAIPFLAFGIPLFDTIFTPMRRFVRGQSIFRPDTGHLHHRLLDMGLSTRKAVLLLYGLTAVLGFCAMLLVNLRDERAGLFLLILGVAAVIFVRKLGYFEYVGSDKIYGWFRDMTDEAGISHGRRTFLNIQIDTGRSSSFQELWRHLIAALELLRFDHAELRLRRPHPETKKPESRRRASEGMEIPHDPERWLWSRNGVGADAADRSPSHLRLVLPLIDDSGKNFGSLKLIKDLGKDSITPYTLRRIEQMRRTLIASLKKLVDGGNA
jgi:UDP-GlcNAc:undecaprenyl-phosphate GlcNAc-1-phosphate transferase